MIITGENNIILRKKSEEVDIINNEIIKFSKNMKKIMYENNWIWLAAPQIWINKQIIVVTFWKELIYDYKYLWDEIMINPKILDISDKKYIDEEWCLSLPWIYGKVLRPYGVKVEYLNLKWEKIVKYLEWLSARVFLHEYDHLNWILFIDKLVWIQEMT